MERLIYRGACWVGVIFISMYCVIDPFAACRKAVEVSPPATSLVGATVFSDNSTASAAVTGIYSSMVSSASYIAGGTTGISALMGISADELTYHGTTALMVEAYKNALVSANPPAIWTPLYNYIYQANAAIAGLAASTGVTAGLKQQLIGESEFIRAFCYFYLVNTYGDVPLATTTNYKVNTSATRASAATVFTQMISDLKDAETKLEDGYLDASGNVTSERIRPNRDAAAALLARIYLYQADWVDAESAASSVIGSSAGYTLTGLDTVFLENNEEAIWQLQAIIPNYDTQDGYVFILTQAPGGGSPFSLNENLLNSFEPGDLRRTNWVDSVNVGSQTYFYPYKYKVKNGSSGGEYVTVLRLGEQLLIRAEARVQQGNLTGAVQDLNQVRVRARLGAVPSSLGQAAILDTIMHERRVELFTEWGHRWFDLRRTGAMDVTMDTVCPQKGGTWVSDHQLFPIPLTEIQVNSNLVQNLGYQ